MQTRHEKKSCFADALAIGGVHRVPPLGHINDVLKHISEHICWEGDLNREFLFDLLKEREKILSTAIGKGVGIPHPRNAKLLGLDGVVAACFYLETPLGLRARDGEDVWCLFALIASDMGMHLKMMRELAHCLQIDTFLEEMKMKPELPVLCQLFEKYENL